MGEGSGCKARPGTQGGAGTGVPPSQPGSFMQGVPRVPWPRPRLPQRCPLRLRLRLRRSRRSRSKYDRPQPLSGGVAKLGSCRGSCSGWFDEGGGLRDDLRNQDPVSSNSFSSPGVSSSQPPRLFRRVTDGSHLQLLCSVRFRRRGHRCLAHRQLSGPWHRHTLHRGYRVHWKRYLRLQ